MNHHLSFRARDRGDNAVVIVDGGPSTIVKISRVNWLTARD